MKKITAAFALQWFFCLWAAEKAIHPICKLIMGLLPVVCKKGCCNFLQQPPSALLSSADHPAGFFDYLQF